MDIYNEIQLEFTPGNIKRVIDWGVSPETSPHSHMAIASWCERFWRKYCDVDASDEIDKWMPLLAEIENEWDIYLAHYTEQHPHSVKSPPQLPGCYFEKWRTTINA